MSRHLVGLKTKPTNSLRPRVIEHNVCSHYGDDTTSLCRRLLKMKSVAGMEAFPDGSNSHLPVTYVILKVGVCPGKRWDPSGLLAQRHDTHELMDE